MFAPLERAQDASPEGAVRGATAESHPGQVAIFAAEFFALAVCVPCAWCASHNLRTNVDFPHRCRFRRPGAGLMLPTTVPYQKGRLAASENWARALRRVAGIGRRVDQLPRLFLADRAIMRLLQIYPIAGSQIRTASLPALLRPLLGTCE